MSLACPECGAAAPADVKPGAVYACPGCRNPVLAAQQRQVKGPSASKAPAKRPVGAVAEDADHEEDGPSAVQEKRRWGPLQLGIIAFVVLGAAYIGAYELLTAEAKRDRVIFEKTYGDALLTAQHPGPTPSAEDPERLKAFLRARETWDARQRYESHGKRIHGMLAGMLGAFALQTALTAYVAIKSRRARAAARAAAAR